MDKRINRCCRCERVLRVGNKIPLCSNCGSISLRELVREGIINIKDIKKVKNEK